ncbi:MAG: hypothetical protein ACM3ZB_02845 [bacterium]|jgi:hypothetical protein
MRKLLLAAAAALPLAAQTAGVCACDTDPELMANARQCSLCREAEKHHESEVFFFLKDNNPRKPNRWLILPVSHRYDGHGVPRGMPRAQRTRFWKAAIERARELFGEEWGLAVNGDRVRTQCHAHAHLGRFNKAAERDSGFTVIDGPEDIPEPADGSGFWIHPVGDKLHLHTGEQICETVLLR